MVTVRKFTCYLVGAVVAGLVVPHAHRGVGTRRSGTAHLANREYRTFGIDIGSSLGFMTSNFADPRTFGLQLTYNFTES